MNRSWKRVVPVAAFVALASCNDIGDDLAAAGPGALAAPSALSASALPGGVQVSLAWLDNSTAETGFRIDVNNAPFGTTPRIVNVVLVPAGSTSHVYETRPGTTLYFRVLAVTDDLESDPSNVVTLTTPNVPFAPAGLTATAVSSTRIDLGWQDVAGENGYRVERSTDGGTTWVVAAAPAADSTSIGDAGLVPDTEYSYRVFAWNGDGDSLPSDVAAAVTQTVAMTVRTVCATGDVGRWASIGLSGGKTYIAHYDAVKAGCVLTYSTAAGDTLTNLLDAGPTGKEYVGLNGLSLALDGAGYVHVAAHAWTGSDLRYISNYPGPPFAALSLDTAGSVGAYPRIAVSPADGRVHIVYLDNLSGPDQIRHATPDSHGVWSFETILPVPAYLASFSLAFDAAGRPHVSLTRSPDGGGYELVHAVKSGASWVLTPVTSQDRPFDTSIAIDASGYPHIVYGASGTARGLMHATSAGGTWITEAVHEGTGGDAGYPNSVAIQPSTGRIHVAYYDAANQDLRYARKDPGGAWVLRLVDSGGDVGRYASLAVDGLGIVHIAYRDETNRSLKVASGAP
jgi:hypothetical protein